MQTDRQTDDLLATIPKVFIYKCLGHELYHSRTHHQIFCVQSCSTDLESVLVSDEQRTEVRVPTDTDAVGARKWTPLPVPALSAAG